MHDAAQLETLGVPSVLIITDPFRAIVDAFAPTVRIPRFPAVAVPHPVSSLDDDALRKLASSVIDQAEAQLTQPITNAV